MSPIRRIKLNKFVLYVSSIALALFGILYSFGEVKAELADYTTISYRDGDSRLTTDGNNKVVDLGDISGDSLVCSFVWTGVGKTLDSIYLNNISAENQLTYAVNTGSGTSLNTRIFYINKTFSGSSSLIFTNASFDFYRSQLVCHSITGSEYDSLLTQIDLTNTVNTAIDLDYSTYDKILFVSLSYNGGSNNTAPNITAIGADLDNQLYYNNNSIDYNASYGHKITHDILELSTGLTDVDIALNLWISGDLGTIFPISLVSASGGEEPLPDFQTEVWGYLNFQSKYQCNRGESCVLRYFYNQNYIPEDTNELVLSSGIYPNTTVVATSTIQDLSLIGKSDGRSFISFDIASTTPRGTYEYFVNVEADDDSWVFSSPIYLEVFNEGEYLNPYPEIEEFKGWGSEWYFKLLSIFPFNIPTSFIIAWNNSATAELPEDLEFLDMADELGNFNASFPKQWLGTPADMEFTLFGYDKIVNGSSRMIVLLENFKKFTTFLQWLMFVWGFWGFAKLVIDNLNVSVVESGTENIHSSVSHSERVDFRGRSSYSGSNSKARSRTTHRSKNIRF